MNSINATFIAYKVCCNEADAQDATQEAFIAIKDDIRITDSANELIKKDIINKSLGQVIEEIYDVKLLEDDV